MTVAAGPEPILETQSLCLAYGRVLAVQDAAFAMAAGERVTLVGRNGSGKSTLMKGVLGLLSPLSGAVRLRIPLGEIAFLPQQRRADDDFPASVWEVALSGCQGRMGFSPFYSARDKNAAAEALSEMGVADLKTKRIGELSGGQRQRVLLARALCREPRLLLLDEPYSGLDPAAAEQFTRLLEKLRDDRGVAVLLSSHDMAAVAGRAGRVIAMDRRIVFDGPAATWLERFGKEGAA